MNGTPLYTSKRAGKNLWQEYRVYPERLELQSWFLFHTLVISASDISSVEVYPPGFIWGIKLDNSNLCLHVVVIKKSGIFKRIGFAPDDPGKFVGVCKSILSNS